MSDNTREDRIERKIQEVNSLIERSAIERAKEVTEHARAEAKRQAVIMTTAVVGVGTAAGGMVASFKYKWAIDPSVAGAVITGLIIAVAVFAIPWLFERRKYMKNRNETFDQRMAAERELHAQALEKLKQASELTTLMQLNQEQIKTYHDIVTEQADKSFKSSRVAMGVGMLLLVCAAIGGAWVPLEQVRWFIGALAAFSTLLSGYLSKTYLTLYKESIGQLNRYFDQPVLNSYYLAAERLIGKLGEEHQDEVRRQIISEILTNSSRRGGALAELKDPKPRAQTKKKKPKKQTSSVNGTPQA